MVEVSPSKTTKNRQIRQIVYGCNVKTWQRKNESLVIIAAPSYLEHLIDGNMFFSVTELWGADKRHAPGFYFLCGETVWYQISAKLEDRGVWGGGKGLRWKIVAWGAVMFPIILTCWCTALLPSSLIRLLILQIKHFNHGQFWVSV